MNVYVSAYSLCYVYLQIWIITVGVHNLLYWLIHCFIIIIIISSSSSSSSSIYYNHLYSIKNIQTYYMSVPRWYKCVRGLLAAFILLSWCYSLFSPSMKVPWNATALKRWMLIDSHWKIINIVTAILCSAPSRLPTEERSEPHPCRTE